MMNERIQIRLSKWNAATSCKIEKKEFDADEDDDDDVEMIDDDSEIVKVGIKSAELIPNNVINLIILSKIILTKLLEIFFLFSRQMLVKEDKILGMFQNLQMKMMMMMTKKKKKKMSRCLT